MGKRVVVLLLGLVITVLGFGFYHYSNNTTPNKPQTTETEIRYFNNPEAIYLRQAFNDYQNAKNDTTQNGLGDFDKSYYSSPFIVYEENNSLAGGKQLEIIFVNNPDKMFTAIIY